MLRKCSLLIFVAIATAGCLAAQSYSTPLPSVNDKDVALLRQNLQAESKKLCDSVRVCISAVERTCMGTMVADAEPDPDRADRLQEI